MGNTRPITFSSPRNVMPSIRNSTGSGVVRKSIEAKRSVAKSTIPPIQEKLALANKTVLLKKNMKWKMIRHPKRSPFNGSSTLNGIEKLLDNVEISNVKRVKA